MISKNYFSALEISSSGLTAERKRMDAIASNIANANTTKTEEGGPYKRKITLFRENEKVNNFDQLLDQARTNLRTTHDSHLLPEDYAKDKFKMEGVEASIKRDQSAPNLIYDPTHPDANPEGYVAMPNINVVSEMVDLINSSRSYEANVTALNAYKGMARNALMI